MKVSTMPTEEEIKKLGEDVIIATSDSKEKQRLAAGDFVLSDPEVNRLLDANEVIAAITRLKLQFPLSCEWYLFIAITSWNYRKWGLPSPSREKVTY